MDQGQPSSWRAERVPAGPTAASGEEAYAFVWRPGNRPYGFAWGQDVGSSGPLPHTLWLQSNRGGAWTGDLASAAMLNGTGASFSPATASVIDDDGVGSVGTRPGSAFCLDVVRGGNVEIWVGPLVHNSAVAAVLNRGPLAADAVVRFADAFPPGATPGRVAVRSAWGLDGAYRDGGGAYAVTVPGHGAALLVLEPA